MKLTNEGPIRGAQIDLAQFRGWLAHEGIFFCVGEGTLDCAAFYGTLGTDGPYWQLEDL